MVEAVTSANDVTQRYESPDPPGGDRPTGDQSQAAGTQQDHTVTQSRFPAEEYPDGTVLVWRMGDPHALGVAVRDDRLAEAAGLGFARWWTPSGAATWDELVLLARDATPPTVLRAWASQEHGEESAGAMLARVGTDAQLWAREFVRLAPPTDEGTMIGWFANAIEVGRSAGYARGREDQAAGIGTWPPGGGGW